MRPALSWQHNFAPRASKKVSGAVFGSFSVELKVSCARRLVREEALELRQRARKRQIASFKHVYNHGRPTLAQMLNILPVVGLGDNRISTDSSSSHTHLMSFLLR